MPKTRRPESKVGSILSDGAVAGSPIPGRVWLVAMLICVAAGIFGAVAGWIWVLTPVICLAGLICLVKPDWGLYLLVCSFFFPYSILANFRLYPADVILFLVVIGFWMQRMRKGKSGLFRTPINLPVIGLFVIMAVSLLNAYDIQRGIINWFRHVQLFLLMFAVIGLSHTSLSKRLIVIFTGIAATLAAAQLLPFVQTGGTIRIFGIARAILPSILSLATVYATARVCFERRRSRMMLYILLISLMISGQITSQTRGSVLGSALGILIVLIVAWRWGSIHSERLPHGRVLQFLVAGAVLTTLTVVAAGPLLEPMLDRFKGVGHAATTMNFRYFMWKTSFDVYLQHPILGIGLGQVQVWHHIFPSLRLDLLGNLTFGIGTHLAFLKYLAETGTVGALALLWFFTRIIQSASYVVRRVTTIESAGHAVGLLGVAMTAILRSFFAGHIFYGIIGMTNILFFGMLLHLYVIESHGSETNRTKAATHTIT